MEARKRNEEQSVKKKSTLEFMATCDMEGFLQPQGYRGFNRFPMGKHRETKLI